MRIAINCLGMKRHLHGVGNYIRNLVWALSRLDRENEYLLFASPENEKHLYDLPDNFHIELAPNRPALRILWEQTVLPWRVRRKRVELYHGPAFAVPLVSSCARVITVHDMTVHISPQRHSLHTWLYLRTMIPAMLSASDQIIADSESAKQDILRLGRVKDSKVSVIYLGVETRFQPIHNEEQLARIRQKYALPRDFILFVGMIEPRKNLTGLVDAYCAASVHDRCDLVLAGSLGWGYGELLQKIRSSSLRDHIRMPGYVDDADLPALYSAAVAFAYPSLYEGFGLPVLEAMACGTPVITSDVSSLPEVTGSTAILVKPDDLPALTQALQVVVNDRNCSDRLSRLGRTRAALFSWDRTAAQTLSVYRLAMMTHRLATASHRNLSRIDAS
jgi:glycosyltransferase involved in cell wall biosynthesis